MKKTALPKSKAKTAYELLSEVCAVIKAEPKRYDQSSWIGRVNGRGLGALDTFKPVPSCGTVGCVAGWVATLKRGDRFRWDRTAGIARKTLGLDVAQAHALFDCDAVDRLTGYQGLEPQTPEYAAVGVRHIRAFQKAHAKQLKAKAV